jgi:hypothetical protein
LAGPELTSRVQLPSHRLFTISAGEEDKGKMSRIDTLQETKRGVGILCRCGRTARITARGQTLCYECFDARMGFVLEPVYVQPRVRERIREFDNVAIARNAAARSVLALGLSRN